MHSRRIQLSQSLFALVALAFAGFLSGTGKPCTAGESPSDVTARGSIIPSESVAVKCKVRSNQNELPVILEIVPEGTKVEEGDMLFKLDSSQLEEKVATAEIETQFARARLLEAEAELETAQLALKEYIEGVAKVEELQLQTELVESQQALLSANADLDSLRESGASAAEIEAAEFQLKRAELEVELCKRKLSVFEEFTRSRVTVELESNIQKSKAVLEETKVTHDLQVARLERAKEELSHCVVSAPSDGIVVYGSGSNGRREVVIEPGAAVREGQTVIQIIDLSKLAVSLLVEEADVEKLDAGQEVEVRVDAYPEDMFTAKIAKINEFADARSWTSRGTRSYSVLVQFDEVPEGIKPGMTTIATIKSEE